jgi:hypothetical protein
METRTDSGRRRLLGCVLAMAAGTLIVVAAAMAFSPRVAAQDQETGRICAERTLRGDYGLLVSGVRRLPPALGQGSEHFVATALWTFHGNGTFTQRTGAAMHGEVTGIAAGLNEVPGTYEVNENCTGNMSLFVPDLPFPVQYSFVIVNNARQVNAAIMNPGVGTAELVRK